MKKALLLAGTALLALTGCVSHHTDRGAQAMATPVSEGGPAYHTNWDVARTRTSANASAGVILGIFTTGEGLYAKTPTLFPGFLPLGTAIEDAKAAATYKACNAAKADALLGAIYDYQVRDYFFVKWIDCSVRGYPAVMTSVEITKDKPVLIGKDQQLVRIGIDESL